MYLESKPFTLAMWHDYSADGHGWQFNFFRLRVDRAGVFVAARWLAVDIAFLGLNASLTFYQKRGA